MCVRVSCISFAEPVREFLRPEAAHLNAKPTAIVDFIVGHLAVDRLR